jgi:hypothetical protein
MAKPRKAIAMVEIILSHPFYAGVTVALGIALVTAVIIVALDRAHHPGGYY